MSNTPTERLDTSGAVEATRSRGLLYALIGLGALLLVGIVVIVVLLLGNNSGQPVASGSNPSPGASASAEPGVSPVESDAPSASPAESPSPSASQTVAAPPPDTKPHFTSFTVPKTEDGCSSGPNYSFTPKAKFSWTTKNAASVWFIYGTQDAANQQYMKVPKNGNQNDLQYGAPDFPCGKGNKLVFTLTIVGTDGSHLSKTGVTKDTSHY
jgi:hypothetical protein